MKKAVRTSLFKSVIDLLMLVLTLVISVIDLLFAKRSFRGRKTA